MNGSRIETEMFYAVFGTHHPYSKIVSYQMLPNTYLRFQTVPSSSSTTFGTRLCFPSTSEIQIPRIQKEAPNKLLSIFVFSTHMFQIVFFSFSFRICQPVCKYQFPAVWCPIFPVLIFGLIIIRERLPFPLF